jgi:L-aspartate oxidase
LLKREIDEFYAHFRVNHDLIELRNLVVTADLIVRCAMQRKESRGLHYSRDYPETLKKAKNSIIKRRRSSR